MEGLVVVALLLSLHSTLCANQAEDRLKQESTSWFANFEELTERSTFVDKTLMLATFFNNVSDVPEIAMITCPRKFGKSTMVDMIKRFAEAEMEINEEDGKIVKLLDHSRDQLFRNASRSMKIGALLGENGQFREKHFQDYAIIDVNLKFSCADVLEETPCAAEFWQCWKCCYENHLWLLQPIFDRYKMLNGQNTLDEFTSSEDTDSVVRLKRARAVMKAEPYKDFCIFAALRDLIDILTEFYPSLNIFLIIQDYDYAILNAVKRNLNSVWGAGKLMKRIFTQLFQSPNAKMRYALITGTLNLNLIDKCEVGRFESWNFQEDHRFARYFGFTNEEVDQLLDKHGIDANEASAVKRYYSSYNIAANSTTRIYNPNSIARYLSKRKPNTARDIAKYLKSYSTDKKEVTNFVRCFKNNTQYGEIMVKLMAFKQIEFDLKKFWSVDDLIKLRDAAHDVFCKLTNSRVDLILSYLFYTGYLTNGDKPGMYRIPGEEIAMFLNRLFD